MIPTKILDSTQIDQAVDLLKQGELVALPTETVYGLAADARNQQAIAKIFTAKGRPSDHPLILHIASFDELNDWVEHIPEQAHLLAAQFWPGPLSMIFIKKRTTSALITGGLDTVAIRIPQHFVMHSVIKKLGNGIVAPSANTYQKTSPTQVAHVLKTLNGKIAAVVDGGIAHVGVESTIIDLTQPIPTIVRLGAITQKMIEEVLKITVNAPIQHDIKISGNMKNHYQPEKPMYLMSAQDIQKNIKLLNNVAIVHYSAIQINPNNFYYQMPSNHIQYAQKIYSMLHEIDQTRATSIVIEMPPQNQEWLHIIDRLNKASTKN